jgi:hypothetical protein
VPDGRLLADAVEEAAGEARRLAAQDGALLAATAVDTSRWELVHFSLWEQDTPVADGEMFEVLHLSAPGRDRLPRGRQW